MHPKSTLLALDTGSPVVSLALRLRSGEVLSESLELRRSSEKLLSSLRRLTQEGGCHLSDLHGLVVLQGPGSFTGLRVGLSTALGLHQALGLPATAIGTLPVLARTASRRLRDGDQVVAVVDALRDEWMAQTFTFEGGDPQPVDTPSLRSSASLAALGLPIVGFDLAALADQGAREDLLWSAAALAPLALEAADHIDWDPGRLVQPIYFRPPAVTPPRR